MKFEVLNPLDRPDWDSMLLCAPGASFFHSSAWAKVLSESYGFTPLYFTVIKEGKLRALLPVMEVSSLFTGKRGVSLPFTDYCDPILDGDISFPEMFSRIIDFGKARGWKYIELRNGNNQLPVASSPFPVSGFVSKFSAFNPATGNREPATGNLQPATRNPFVPFVSYLGHTLDLTKGEKALYSGLRDSTRRNIKKAVAQGVEIRVSNDLGGVQEFYRLNCLTRKLHGLPSQPSFFFNQIHNRVISADKGFVVLASHGGKNIAGSVFLHFGDKAIFKYGASDRKYQEMRANNLVMWEAIRWFANKGFNSLCLGRTELENEGLRQFKNGWGTEERQILYFRYDLREGAFVPGKRMGEPAYAGLFRAMPLPVLNLIGSLFYRHMG